MAKKASKPRRMAGVSTVKVKLLSSRVVQIGAATVGQAAGDIVEMDQADAERNVERGHAQYVESPVVEERE